MNVISLSAVFNRGSVKLAFSFSACTLATKRSYRLILAFRGRENRKNVLFPPPDATFGKLLRFVTEGKLEGRHEGRWK